MITFPKNKYKNIDINIKNGKDIKPVCSYVSAKEIMKHPKGPTIVLQIEGSKKHDFPSRYNGPRLNEENQ